MSYEGYEEWLCEVGHYSTSDCYDPRLTECRVCGGAMKWRHPVDQTNGEDVANPHDTSDATKTLLEYTPAGHRWAPCSMAWRLVGSSC